ncbi:MAG TPA: hypothetical protein VGB77_20710 [Abditibacteriaceae bacterium]|jgi:hypothetical protein
MICKKNPQHRYNSHLKACPWCERQAQLSGHDPFPPDAATQRAQKAAELKRQQQEAARLEAAAAEQRRLLELKRQQEEQKRKQEAERRRREAEARRRAEELQRTLGGLAKTVGACVFGVWVIGSGMNCMNNMMQSSARRTYTAAPQQSVTQITMPSPGNKFIPTKVMGIWRGTFSGDSATLHIRTRDDNRFTGLMTVRDKKGTYRIAISGVVADGGRIGWQETKVLRVPRKAKWTRGTNTGTFSNANQTMSGQGKDPLHSVYSWSFRRAS